MIQIGYLSSLLVYKDPQEDQEGDIEAQWVFQAQEDP